MGRYCREVSKSRGIFEDRRPSLWWKLGSWKFLWIGKANGTNWVDDNGQGIEIQDIFWLLLPLDSVSTKKVEELKRSNLVQKAFPMDTKM